MSKSAHNDENEDVKVGLHSESNPGSWDKWELKVWRGRASLITVIVVILCVFLVPLWLHTI